MISYARECNNCHKDIYFDTTKKSKNGKSIPLDVDTDLPHECKNQKGFIGDMVMDLEKKERGY